MNQDYLTQIQTDLTFLIEAMFLWGDVEATWEFPEEFSKKFEAWLKKKAQEKAEELMEYNP